MKILNKSNSINNANIEVDKIMIRRIFLDTETTGTDPVKNGVHQISGCIEIDEIIVETFDYKIRPFEGCEYSKEAAKKMGWTPEQLQQNEYSEFEFFMEFKSMLGRYISQFDKTKKFYLVGYNIKFDEEMLLNVWERNKDDFYFSLFWGCIDIMSLAAFKLENVRSEMPNFQLITVAKKLGLTVIEENFHDSLYDIQITRDIFYALKNYSSESNNSNNVKT